MNFAIRLSCILALLFCLASTGNAGAIDRDSQKIQDLQRRSEANTDPNAEVYLTYEAVELYKKYRGQDVSNAAKEQDLNAKVDEFESKIVLVEGVPKQGGGFWNFFKVILKPTPTNIVISGIAEYLLGHVFNKIIS